MPTMKSGDVNIYYEVYGSGEPIVLLPGIGTDISNYKRIIEPLSKKYQVIAIDTIGSGQSDKPDKTYSVEKMADDVVAVMQAANVKTSNILGVSLGGRIAMALALNHPSQVKSLVLVSCGARATKRTLWSSFLGIMTKLPILKGSHPQPSYAQQRLRQASLDYDCTQSLPNIIQPTLVMHGRFDGIVKLSLAKEVQANISNSKLVTFWGGHLFLLVTRTQGFLRLLNGFLQEA